ncbi:MAG TPA: fatty acyl-AMP ligase [Polyangiaceae bacterium]|jgi:acyl-CoA synthetase (AMP-forming)/AMP-acid ligase II|nr:fatty acyl-AMP ligase [Polyangiaceae bacterium]
MLSILSNPNEVQLRVATLNEALEQSARNGALFWTANKDADALELRAATLLERAHCVAQRLVSLGLRRGDRAVIMLPTSVDWLAAFFGVLLAGGAAVPLGPNLSFGGMDRYAETVQVILRSADARFLLVNGAIDAHLPKLCGKGSPLEHVVRVDELTAGDSGRLPSVSPEDVAVIQYTSGTTGAPKGVVLSHRALLANAHMIGERARMTPNDVGVSWLPLFHDMGLVGALLTALYWQYPLLLMPVESFLLQPRRWLQWLAKRRATLSVAPNFAYQFVLDRVSDRHLVGLDLSAWRCAFNGAEAVRVETLRAFAQRFDARGFAPRAFQPVYGMAENSLAATFPDPGQPWRSVRAGGRECVSVGTPLSGVTVAIVDGQEQALPAGVSGAIRLRSPSLMDGYFRNEQATAEVLNEGWLRTGDIGFVQDGELFITGRSKEIIVKRGRNYGPDELEEVALRASKGRVLRAAAFGTPDGQDGTERIVLVLETHPVNEHEKDLLARDVGGALVAAIGIAHDVLVVVPPKTIERTTSGKIRRVTLKTHFLQGTLPRHASGSPPTVAPSST